MMKYGVCRGAKPSFLDRKGVGGMVERFLSTLLEPALPRDECRLPQSRSNEKGV